VPLSIPASWAIDTFGLRWAVGFGAVLLTVFGLLRGFIGSSYGVTLALTVGIAAAQPFLLNAYTNLAAQWFGVWERATAVGLMTVAAFVGIIIGEVLTPSLVAAHGIGGMQQIYGVATAVSGVLFLALFRERPSTSPSPEGTQERALVLDGLRAILKGRDFWVVAAGFLVVGGIFNGLSTWVEGIAGPKGFSAGGAGLLVGVMLLGAMLGAVVMPLASDRRQRRKPVLLAGLIAGVPALAVLTLSRDYPVVMAAFFAVGFFMIGVAPVMYQYGAEITYPAPEGTSNGLFVMAMQVSVVFIYAMGWLDGVAGSFTPSLLALVALEAATCVLFAYLSESPAMPGGAEPAADAV